MNKQQAQQRLAEIEAEKEALQKILNKPTKEERFWQLVSGLTIKIDREKYPNAVFFFREDECWIEYNANSGYLWLRYSTIWSVFEKEFELSYGEIQAFIKIAVEDHFKCKGVTPPVVSPSGSFWVEDHFKNHQ